MYRIVRFAILLTLVGALNAYASVDDTIRKTFNAADGGTLILESDLGSIDVTTGGAGISIEVLRTAKGSSDEAAALLKRNEITFDQSGNEIRVRSRYDRDGGFFHIGPDLEVRFNVRVPAHFNVTLSTAGGSINVSDLTGNVGCRTSGGSLKLARTNGPIHAKTSGGSITVQSATGAIEARTSGGSINVENADGSLDAKTSGGSINVRRVGGPAVLRTSGGHIDVDEALDSVDAATSGGSINATFSRQPQRDSRLVTSGGNINVHVAPDLRLDIDAHASGGGVSSEIPVTVVGTVEKHSLSGKLNGGGPKLEAKTSGGSVSLHKK
jgi:DUF4097 and DUF4098 domain-containing protein YvlB